MSEPRASAAPAGQHLHEEEALGKVYDADLLRRLWPFMRPYRGQVRFSIALIPLRAALEVFEPCFPHKPFKTTLREVKALADALGERRDRDVTIAALEDFCKGIGRPDVRGVQSLIAQVREEQSEANLALDLGGLILGSETQRVLAHSKIPVLVPRLPHRHRVELADLRAARVDPLVALRHE